MKKFVFIISLVFLTCMGAFSQNFNRVTQIIETAELTNGQAAYFVGSYLGSVRDNATDEEAFDVLKKEGLFKESAAAADKIKLQDLCALYAKAVQVKGGMMFTFTKKSARYSFKEFKAKGWLPKNADPSMKVSGVNAMGLFNSVTGGAK